MPDMKLYILPLRSIPVFYDDLVQPEPGTARSTRKVDIPTWALYIDHPQGKVLFDTGERYLEDRSQPYDALTEQLALCGVAPEEIDWLVMSHLHYDHAGKIDLFRNAKVVVQKRELMDALYETHVTDPDGIYHREDLEHISNWHPVEGEQELLPGIRLICLPGHTAGLQGVVVSLPESGNWIITSDACYTVENYGPPLRPAGVVSDIGLYRASAEKLRGLETEYHARLLFGHDPFQFAQWKKAPEYYR